MPYNPITEAGDIGAPKPANESADAGDRASLQTFFEGYARALTRGDAKTVAALWEAPALVLSREGAHAVAAESEVEAFFAGAKDQYDAQGIVDTRPEIVSLREINDALVTAEVRWPWLDADGRVLGEERTTYTLRRDQEGRPRVRVAVMHGGAASH